MAYIREDILSKYLPLESSRSIESFWTEIKFRKIFLLTRDFSIEANEMPMQGFCKSYNLSSLVKLPSCYKNSENTTCIDLC